MNTANKISVTNDYLDDMLTQVCMVINQCTSSGFKLTKSHPLSLWVFMQKCKKGASDNSFTLSYPRRLSEMAKTDEQEEKPKSQVG